MGIKRETTEGHYHEKKEEAFHDEWASLVDVDKIDVLHVNEATTAPEMRYIHQQLGDLAGKRILDVGCGIGEASVYFACKGAIVTSSDLSSGMLQVTSSLANRYGVNVETHLATAESIGFPVDRKFDMIYSGNLLHHVDIESAIKQFHQHLIPGGLLVTWDPLVYNPAINFYRSRAMEVRTKDEHPLSWNDLRLFNKYFNNVNRKYFWLSTLIIFIYMAIIQRRDPNKERYWKVIIDESERWGKIYRPLEIIDKILLTILPPLRLLCWNVVVIAKK